jgi:hypothetical protein
MTDFVNEEDFKVPEFLYDVLTEEQLVTVRKHVAARWAAGYHYALGETDASGRSIND